MATLSLNAINKSFGAAKVLHDISLAIEDKEFVVFVGPSGCGKSTLLRIIAGLEEADDLKELNDYIVEFDRGFHRTIVAALDNKAVTKAHEYIQTKLRIARLVHRRVPPRKTNLIAMQDHLAILEALTTGDLDKVRAALDAHFVQSVRNTLVGY